MTEQNSGQAGAGTSASELSDPAAKTQPAEGGRDEVDEGFDPESSGETPRTGWTEQEDSSTEGSRP
jgi:hypothetical protein